MSTLSDGLSNVYALTAQINALKSGNKTPTTSAASQQTSPDPQTAILQMQQNFNDMLDSLITSPDDTRNKEKNDPLAAFLNEYQASLPGTNSQTTQSNSTSNINVNSYTGSVETNQAALLAIQNQLNLDNIF